MTTLTTGRLILLTVLVLFIGGVSGGCSAQLWANARAQVWEAESLTHVRLDEVGRPKAALIRYGLPDVSLGGTRYAVVPLNPDRRSRGTLSIGRMGRQNTPAVGVRRPLARPGDARRVAGAGDSARGVEY